MSEQQGFQFRTAAFGGFQKQDVMAYLEQSAREHAEKLAALKKELAEEKQSRSADGEKFAALEQKAQALEAENQRLAADLAERVAAFAQATAGKTETEALLAELRAKVEKLTPAAEAYEAFKDRTAGIELEAHGRAQQIEEEGRRKAQEFRREATEWFAGMRETYDKLHTDVDTIVDRAARELAQAGSSLEGLKSTFTEYDTAMEALKEKVGSIGTPKQPDPLTLPDERTREEI